MALLSWARLIVAWVPFDRWRGSLGLTAKRRGSAGPPAEARLLVAAVERAAVRLPFATKCLPRAMALSWMLRREGIGHAVVIAVRPERLRGSDDDLHAWVEMGGTKLIGDLPGPWLESARLASNAVRTDAKCS